MTLQRPENRHQVAILRRLRDEGPRSRAELGDGVELSRSKLAAEVDRLIELGLVEVVFVKKPSADEVGVAHLLYIYRTTGGQ